MKLVVVTPIRLFGEGLASCFSHCTDISLHATVCDLIRLRQCLQTMEVDIVLIDVTQSIDLDEVRAIASERTDVALVALGLREERRDVVRCGRAGFSGYVDRNASIEGLCQALSNASSGRLACSAEISGGLLRALFGLERRANPMELGEALTRREGEVLQLIGQGLSNKEIARHLRLSLATVKHHVHHILQKLKLPRRAQAMRRVRETPWIASSAPSLIRHQDFD
jgi:DNA-binding NarL/FixJ family response regulator